MVSVFSLCPEIVKIFAAFLARLRGILRNLNLRQVVDPVDFRPCLITNSWDLADSYHPSIFIFYLWFVIIFALLNFSILVALQVDNNSYPYSLRTMLKSIGKS